MTKGTQAFGKKGRSKSHIKCRRCGRRSYSLRRRRCAACGYGASSRLKRYSWQNRDINRERRI